MRTINLILFFLFFNSLMSNGQTWGLTGDNGVISNSSSFFYFSKSTAIDKDGIVYVAYKKSDALYVSKYSGDAWEQLGDVVSTNVIESICISIHPGTGIVYVAYANDGGGKLGVKAYYNNQWTQVGQELSGTNLFYKISTAFTATGVLLIGGFDAWGVPFTKILSGGSWSDIDMSSFVNFKGFNPASLFFDKAGKAYFAYPYNSGAGNVIKVLHFEDNRWQELNTGNIPVNIDGRIKALVSPDGGAYLGYIYAGSFYLKRFNSALNDWESVGSPILSGQLFDVKFLSDGTPILLYGDEVKWLKNGAWATLGNNFIHSGIDYYLESDRNGNLYVVYQNGSTVMAKTFSTSTLPVKLISFKSSTSGNFILLNWNSANETNNKGYIVERSSDGHNFTPISYLQASATLRYIFNDTNPVVGTNYYKLVQEDFNGTKTTLGITSSNLSLQTTTFSVYPNPFKGNVLSIQLDAVNADKMTNIAILDVAGRVISKHVVNSSEGLIRLPLGNNLKQGVYYVKVDSKATKLVVSE